MILSLNSKINGKKIYNIKIYNLSIFVKVMEEIFITRNKDKFQFKICMFIK